MMNLKNERFDDNYYHFRKDYELFPECWVYCVYSKRGPGKTYSGLRMMIADKIPFIYMKRTIEDVELICSANNEGFDPSPFVPLNRDFGTNIKAKSIKKGLGAFYHCDEDNNPIGLPVGYILALNGIKKFKGFDFSIVDFIIFDEFIPQRGEIIRSGTIEGEMLLDLYMTIARDRQKRGRGPLRLVLFANSEEVSTPVTNVLEIVDDIVELNNSGDRYFLIEDRGILIHHITNEEVTLQEEEKTGIYAAMKHTAWGAKAFEGEFSMNDFSNVAPFSIKKAKPYIHIHYKTFDYYIYLNDSGCYYMCTSKNKCLIEFDLNKENDQKLFFFNHGAELRMACAEDRFKFQKYSMYDLIINYKKFFKL